MKKFRIIVQYQIMEINEVEVKVNTIEEAKRKVITGEYNQLSDKNLNHEVMDCEIVEVNELI